MAASLILIVCLAVGGVLSIGALIAIAAASSLTYPLSNSGTRTLLPLLLPPSMWDRANAVDSAGFVIAMIVGPALAGTVAGTIDPSAALIAAVGFFSAAAVVVSGISETGSIRGSDRALMADAAAGIVYVARNRTFRGPALGLSASNLGYGLAIVAVPVLVIHRLNGGAGEVGALWACVGVAGAASGLVVGRLGTEGRERQLVIFGMLLIGVVGAFLALAGSLAVAAVALVVFGLANGPIDIGMFSMRQRRTDRAWPGRAFTISAALNFSGVPIGSLLAGPLVPYSLTAAFVAMAGVQLVGVLSMVTVPAEASETLPAAAVAPPRDRP